jgi:hypothetical protein
MKRLLPGAVFVLSAALGCADGVEIPTVELGSGGARLMNGQAKSPAEAYDKAYSYLGRAHLNVRRNLETRSQNLVGAREGMELIVKCLETMRACVPEADRPRYEPYVAKYGAWLKDLENGTWGGSFLTDFDRLEREVKSTFNPSSVEILAEFPRSRPPAAKPVDAVLTPDKVELPAVKNPPAEEPAKKPEPPPPTPAVTTRIFYKAWSAAHDDLIAAYKDKKPCKEKYDVVVESLRLLKAQFTGEKVSKLQIYIDYYGGVDEKTKTFTSLPEKTTEKDIVDELDVAARVIRKEFNPDR